MIGDKRLLIKHGIPLGYIPLQFEAQRLRIERSLANGITTYETKDGPLGLTSDVLSEITKHRRLI